mmetsp:Transcript_149435/g.461314  ORF Transcript_149435/g.461314 Transcript_149435/m.461314 type:complete len:205 (-) Transcript_149435:132-746(-)
MPARAKSESPFMRSMTLLALSVWEERRPRSLASSSLTFPACSSLSLDSFTSSDHVLKISARSWESFTMAFLIIMPRALPSCFSLHWASLSTAVSSWTLSSLQISSSSFACLASTVQPLRQAARRPLSSWAAKFIMTLLTFSFCPLVKRASCACAAASLFWACRASSWPRISLPQLSSISRMRAVYCCRSVSTSEPAWTIAMRKM